jgi:hypothetical protein
MSDVLLLAFPDPFDHGIHREPSVEEVIEWLRGRGHIHDLSHNAGKGLLICHSKCLAEFLHNTGIWVSDE